VWRYLVRYKYNCPFWRASDRNERRNGKLVNSLLCTNFKLTVMIISYCLVQDRLLSTRGKRWMEHVANRREKCVQVLMGKPEVKGILVCPMPRWKNNIKIFLQRVDFETWAEIFCFGTRTSVLCFWLWQGKFCFHKTLGIAWLADNLSASQEGLCLIGIFI